jgi:hypothetical protein
MPLPTLYDRWMHEVLGADVPEETAATCADCVMCAADDDPSATSIRFDAVTKCCTYTPSIPNFLVGRILTSEGNLVAEHGRRTLLERLKDADTNPISVDCPRDRRVLYVHRAGDDFGRTPQLQCPHYIDGACGVWQNRTANCATWYCRHTRGAGGQRAWSAMRRLLQEVEQQLSLWCAMRLGFRASALWPLVTPEPTDSSSPVPGAPLRCPPNWFGGWGDWQGGEADFYLQCAAAVEPLTWSTVREICGCTTMVLEELTRELFTPLMTPGPLPTRLTVGAFEVARVSHQGFHVVTYSDYDPVELPHGMLALLPHFDGRPTDEVLDRFRDDSGIEIGAGFLRRLVDFDILVPSDPPSVCR